MSWEQFVWFFAATAIAWTAGLLMGVVTERRGWVMRALTRERTGATAHHCDGKFYYVVEESVFVHDYQRRPIPKEEEAAA